MLIGLCGRAQAGKSAAAKFLVDSHGFEMVALADPIREFVAKLVNCGIHDLDVCKDHPNELLAGHSPRYAMQTLGTQWGRDTISSTLWLDICMRRVDALVRRDVVIPDVRFDDEARAITQRGGIIVHVSRPGDSIIESAHASEQGISHGLIHAFVENNTTLDWLHTQLSQKINACLIQGEGRHGSTVRVRT